MATTYKVCAPGVSPTKYVPGDFILVKTTHVFARFIQFGQSLRYHGEMKAYSYWNHCAIVVDTDGSIIEALNGGVKKTNISKYEGVEYYYVSTKLNKQSRTQAVKAAESFLNDEYSWLTIASISLNLTLGLKIQVTRNNTMICSGVVAQSLWAAGVIVDSNPYQMLPADLASAYNVIYTPIIQKDLIFENYEDTVKI